MIDVIIPAHNCFNTLEKTLCSIAYQKISDKINVIVVNDGSEKDYSIFIEFFSNFISIKEIILDKCYGISVARQTGINNSKSPYIIFMDSGDCFASSYSAKQLLEKIEKEKLDLVIGTIKEEQDNGYVENYNSNFLQGKIFSRKYLYKKDIMFTDSKYDEINYFINLLSLSVPKKAYVSDAVMLICQKDYYFENETSENYNTCILIEYINNISLAVTTAIEKKYSIGTALELAYATFIYMYYWYLANYNQDCTYIIRNLKLIYEIINRYEINENVKLDIMKSEYDIFYNDETKYFLLNPHCSLESFFEIVNNL